MTLEFDVLDKVKESKRGMGFIICMYDKKIYLRENLVVLPINFVNMLYDKFLTNEIIIGVFLLLTPELIRWIGHNSESLKILVPLCSKNKKRKKTKIKRGKNKKWKLTFIKNEEY